MTDVRVPGYDVWLDPTAITKVEIGKADAGVPVRIFLQNESEPRVVRFPTKQEALDFYAAVWRLKVEAQPDP